MVKRLLRVISSALKDNDETEHVKKGATTDNKVEAIPPISAEEEVAQTANQIIIDGSTGEVIEASPQESETTVAPSPITERQKEIREILRDHPEEVIKLAAINDAFYRGILALQKLNLDEDLYLQAIEDLRRKYYQARSQNLEKMKIPPAD